MLTVGEKGMLRWLAGFVRALTEQQVMDEMRSRNMYGGLRFLIRKGLIRKGKGAMQDFFECTVDGRRLVVVLDVMES